MARQMVDVYAEFAINGAAMPVIAGASSPSRVTASSFVCACHPPCLQPNNLA